jgi:hypothetical protein
MAIEIKEITLVDNYMHCRFEGHFESFEEIIENTKHVMAAYHETGCSNAILDFTAMSGRFGIWAEHALGIHISTVMPRGARVAVLPPTYMKAKATGHLENVVANRRGRFAVFWNIEDAISWLEDGAARLSRR